MEKMICGLIFLAVLIYLAYRAYCFGAKNEIRDCFGKKYLWRDEQKEINGAKSEEDKPKYQLE